MTRRSLLAAAAAMLCGTAGAAAQGLHLQGGRSTNWPWTVTDAAGYRWDVNANGQIDDGTNDCYDGAMLMRVGGSQFSWSSPGKLSADGAEVEVGPWTHGSIRVWRRVYIDKKMGYCRWIDIFENTAGSAQSAALQYYTNMGGSVYMTHTTSGQANLSPKDWGIVTSSSSGSSRPSVVHVFATWASKLKPRFQWSRGNDNVYYHVSLSIPANKTVALCFFEAQRRPYAQAQAFLKGFRPERELKKVPAVLRRIILNMGGAVLTLGRLELPRSDKHDLVVLRNGNELLGTIGNPRYLVETFFEKLDLPAERVVGLSVPIESERIELGMVDGQVVCGKLLNAPLKLALATGGSEMELPPAKVRTAAYRLSESRPDEIAITRPMIVLRSGERLYFNPDDADLTFHTRYGDVKLSREHVKAVQLDTPEGGLHTVTFRNGSVLSGLLIATDLKLGLALGPTLRIRRHVVERFLFPGDDAGGTDAAEMKLRNDDELFGKIADKRLTVKTRFGDVVVAPNEIAEIVFPEASLGRVQIKLHNGTTITGQFLADVIRFQIGAGPTLAVSVGHVASLTGTKPKGAAKPPAPEPEPPSPDVDRTEIRTRTEPAVPIVPPPVPPPGAVAKAVGPVAVVAPAKPAPAPATRPANPTTRPAAMTPGQRRAAEIQALTARCKALEAQVAEARKRLANNLPAAEADHAKRRMDLLQQLHAVADKELAVAKQRLAATETRVAQLRRQRAQLAAALDRLRKDAAKDANDDQAKLLKQRIATIESELAELDKVINALQ